MQFFRISHCFYTCRSFEMCLKSWNDATVVMLKLLHVPVTYRYITIQVTKRGESKAETAEQDAKTNDEAEKENDSEIYTEVEETGKAWNSCIL